MCVHSDTGNLRRDIPPILRAHFYVYRHARRNLACLCHDRGTSFWVVAGALCRYAMGTQCTSLAVVGLTVDQDAALTVVVQPLIIIQ